MDSYFHLAVYMIYYLSVNLWSIDYFVCLQKKNARRRWLSQAFSLIILRFAERNYSPEEYNIHGKSAILPLNSILDSD